MGLRVAAHADAKVVAVLLAATHAGGAARGEVEQAGWMSWRGAGLHSLFHTSPQLMARFLALTHRLTQTAPHSATPPTHRMYLTRSRAQEKPPSTASKWSCPWGGSPRSAKMLRMPNSLACGASASVYE